RDTPEPSVLTHEILNAKPYAFLDDAPLEERRTQAVLTRRGLDVRVADDLGSLDQAAIDRVREEAWPEARDPDEMHDVLSVAGCLKIGDRGLGIGDSFAPLLDELRRVGRATVINGLWVATERVPMLLAVFPGAAVDPPVQVPERDQAKAWTREDGIRE